MTKALQKEVDRLRREVAFHSEVSRLLLLLDEPVAAPGVYVLCLDDTCIYVGQSQDVHQRLHGHRLVTFDRVRMIHEANARKRLWIESTLIAAFKPVLNGNHGTFPALTVMSRFGQAAP